jgi:hypothetical protein
MNYDEIALATIRAEIEDCAEHCEKFGWEISEIDVKTMSFTVKMESPIDHEIYLLWIEFQNYKEWPLFIEFMEHDTLIPGTKKAYPAISKKHGNFFLEVPCICHPASRKAYKGYKGVHAEWEMNSWIQNSGTLINLKAILEAIYFRINNEEIYGGRMCK